MKKQLKNSISAVLFLIMILSAVLLLQPKQRNLMALTTRPDGTEIPADTTNPTDQATRVHFNDPNLEIQVWQWVNNSGTAPADPAVTIGQLQKMTGFLYPKYVTDLEGLQYARTMSGVSITEANLISGTVNINYPQPTLTTLAPLANLPSLTSVTFTGGANTIDMSALGTIPNLETVSLNGIKAADTTNDYSALLGISDLEFLRNASKLTTLTLSSTGISSMSGIENLQNVKTLTVLNNTNLSYVPNLANMTALNTLDMNYNPLLTDLSFLSNCPQYFTRVSLNNYRFRDDSNAYGTFTPAGKITDVSPLSTLHAVDLRLKGNSILDLSAIDETITKTVAIDQRISYAPTTMIFDNPLRRPDGSFAALKYYGYGLTYGMTSADPSNPQALSHPVNPDGSFDVSKIKINTTAKSLVTMEFGYRDYPVGSNAGNAKDATFNGFITFDLSQVETPSPTIAFVAGTQEFTIESNNNVTYLTRQDVTITDGVGRDVTNTYTGNYSMASTDKPMKVVVSSSSDGGTTYKNVYVYTGTTKDCADDYFHTGAVGIYKIEYTYTNQFNKTVSATRLITVEDTTPPTISGIDPIELDMGESFDLYFNVRTFDLSEFLNRKQFTIVSNPVDVNKPGTYTVVYETSDKYGNTAQFERKVTVIDSVNPVISGGENTTVEVDPNAVDPFDAMAGVTAMDEPDGDITDKVVVDGTVDLTKVGVYTLTYTVTDAAGNKSTVIRKVSVVDTHAPTLTGVGDTSVACLNDTRALPLVEFDPLAGVTVTDNADQNLKIQVTGKVNMYWPGEYILTYTVYDASGNKAVNLDANGNPVPITRKVTVTDNNNPTISGAANKTIAYGSYFNPMLGVTANDYEYGVVTNRITFTGTVNTRALGTYTLTYKVTDPSGREVTVVRTITVADQNKPIISGATAITIPMNSTFYPKVGVTARDIEDGVLTSSITVSGTVNTKAKGIYNLTYTVKDKAGNTTTVVRKVTVA